MTLLPPIPAPAPSPLSPATVSSWVAAQSTDCPLERGQEDSNRCPTCGSPLPHTFSTMQMLIVVNAFVTLLLRRWTMARMWSRMRCCVNNAICISLSLGLGPCPCLACCLIELCPLSTLIRTFSMLLVPLCRMSDPPACLSACRAVCFGLAQFCAHLLIDSQMPLDTAGPMPR